ncbi:MAG: efflux RND transporter periplasmic adaptor subunit [Methylobacteriaceae bacterium]|nr:efflux RND transporter periplasmic adaptor subunit [Methylobacteriaceae bacterium]
MAVFFRGSQARDYVAAVVLVAVCANPVPAKAADTQSDGLGMAVSVTKVRRLRFTDSLQLTGHLVAREQVPVRPDAEGLRVIQILVEDGDRVTAGQVLARLARTEGLPGPTGTVQVTAPVAGIVLGQAPPSPRAQRPEPMFRIIVNGEIEADIEAPAVMLPRLSVDQEAQVEIPGTGTVSGRVRAISPEVDPASQLAHLRISFKNDGPKNDGQLHVGSFAKASILIGNDWRPSVPLTAILYGAERTVVQVVRNGKIETQPVKVGLTGGQDIEVREGLDIGDVVVRRAGSFLREGDVVRQIADDAS